jgi:N6-L-threonylcarbamoyladenine synthase
VVSGGHTSIYRVDGFGEYKEVSRTRDDAAGEAFDKVAKLLGLGYPGGPLIEEMASRGDPEKISFPKSILPKSLDFSYSGLKTAVLTHIRNNPDSRKEDIAAGFQSAAIEVLINKTLKAAKKERVKSIALSGGVSANSLLRDEMKKRAEAEGIEVYLPSLKLCTDNAAMIAAAGFHHFQQGNFTDFSLNPKAYLPL